MVCTKENAPVRRMNAQLLAEAVSALVLKYTCLLLSKTHIYYVINQ